MAFWLRLFSRFFVSQKRIQELLSSSSPAEQRKLFGDTWKNWKWDLGFRLAFQRWILRWVYGRELIENLPTDFRQHMQTRVEHFLTAFPALENPYLWQAFNTEKFGRTFPPYLESFGQVDFRIGTLEEQISASLKRFDLLALSNILEVANPSQLQETQTLLHQATKPGAQICLRFMAPRPPVFTEFQYLVEKSQTLSKSDRACFCNQIQIYRVV